MAGSGQQHQQERREESGQQPVQRHRQRREGARDRVDLESARRPYAVGGKARREPPRPTTAVRSGKPPISRATPMAIGAVTDFGATEATRAPEPPSALASRTALATPVSEPATSAKKSATSSAGSPASSGRWAPRARPSLARGGRARTAPRRSKLRSRCRFRPAPPDDRDTDEHRIDGGVSPGPVRDGVGEKVGGERQGEPEQGRGGQEDPEGRGRGSRALLADGLADHTACHDEHE